MRPSAITAILEEHQALVAVLRVMRLHIAHAGRAGGPDFSGLRAMLLFLSEFPARLHHVNEQRVLFPRVRRRCPALGPVLDRLAAEQQRSDAAMRELSRALLAYEVLGARRREAFEQLAHPTITGFLGHIEVEDNYILAVAMDCLDAEDWCEVERGWSLGDEGGPVSLREQYRQLFRRILFEGAAPMDPRGVVTTAIGATALNEVWR